MNLVEILRNCPQGTKLYSPIYGDVSLLYVEKSSNAAYPIMVETDIDDSACFTADGRFYTNYNGECMLFPSKENRDWSTFKYPKKDLIKPGDIIISDGIYYLMKDQNTIIFSYDSKSECIGFGCSHIIPKDYIKAPNKEWFFKKMEERGFEYDPVNIDYKEIEI